MNSSIWGLQCFGENTAFEDFAASFLSISEKLHSAPSCAGHDSGSLHRRGGETRNRCPELHSRLLTGLAHRADKGVNTDTTCCILILKEAHLRISVVVSREYGSIIPIYSLQYIALLPTDHQ